MCTAVQCSVHLQHQTERLRPNNHEHDGRPRITRCRYCLCLSTAALQHCSELHQTGFIGIVKNATIDGSHSRAISRDEYWIPVGQKYHQYRSKQNRRKDLKTIKEDKMWPSAGNNFRVLTFYWIQVPKYLCISSLITHCWPWLVSSRNKKINFLSP